MAGSIFQKLHCGDKVSLYLYVGGENTLLEVQTKCVQDHSLQVY